jgi:hypothetical protein
MLTEKDVIALYRCLLGRAPDDAGTIKAFLDYYPALERGRKAMFASKEFQRFYASVTGHLPFGTENTAALLCQGLLARASAGLPPPPKPADPALRTGLEAIFRRLAKARLVVAVGDNGETSLSDLAPMARADAAILHIAPGFPPFVPLVSQLDDTTTLLRLNADIAGLDAFLRTQSRQIDALYLLDAPSSAEWAEGLRARFAEQCLVVVGRPGSGFDAAGISARIVAAHKCEPVQMFSGLRLHHLGGWLLPVTYDAPADVPPPPTRSDFPKLAIAAIVRDEAACIENMLRSATPIASFVAVLDTGSTDETPALAQAVLRSAGIEHKFAQKSREAFGNDFSAMRNAALDMVPADIDWVLMLDADEEIVPEDYVKILELITLREHDAYALPRYNFPGADKTGEMSSYPDRQVRLLRHTPEKAIRYCGAVHEKVQNIQAGRPPLDATAMGGERGGPHIHHLVRRFRDSAREEAKQAFYREIAAQQT